MRALTKYQKNLITKTFNSMTDKPFETTDLPQEVYNLLVENNDYETLHHDINRFLSDLYYEWSFNG